MLHNNRIHVAFVGKKHLRNSGKSVFFLFHLLLLNGDEIEYYKNPKTNVTTRVRNAVTDFPARPRPDGLNRRGGSKKEGKKPIGPSSLPYENCNRILRECFAGGKTVKRDRNNAETSVRFRLSTRINKNKIKKPVGNVLGKKNSGDAMVLGVGDP